MIFCSILQGNGQEYNLVVESSTKPPAEIAKLHTDFSGDSTAIQNRLREIVFQLQNEGFLAASIDSTYNDSENLYAKLYVGQKFYWANLNVSELESELLHELKLSNSENFAVNLNDFKNLKQDILSYYNSSGFPFTEVHLSNFEIEDSLFHAELKVDKDEYYLLDSLIVKGGAKISDTYLERKLNLKSGMPFNQKQINELSNTLDNIRFLSEIKPAEIEFTKEDFDLYLYLEKKRANTFNGLIGFLPNRDKNDDLLITGELTLNLINSFGRGEEILLNWEKLESSTQKLDIGFAYPYLFKTNIGLDSEFGLYKKDSTFLSLDAGVGLRFFLTHNDYVKFYYRYKSSSRIGNENDQTTSINFADTKSNLFGLSYDLNHLDYIFNPRKGVKLNVFSGVGFKTISGLEDVNDSLNITTDNTTIELEAGLDLDIYYPLYGNFVFRFRNSTRYLDQFAGQDKEALFFENELYRFGGANTLRGFDESIFYASIYSIQNAEIRYLFERNSAFYLFWNGAYYYKNVAQSVTEDFPWGFGIGMDFQTKAGIFSLSYALGKQFDNPFEIRTAKIHFGYISRF